MMLILQQPVYIVLVSRSIDGLKTVPRGSGLYLGWTLSYPISLRRADWAFRGVCF
jgi:hypothetical protein